MNNSTTLYFFYSDWCGMCKVMSPKLQEIEKQFENHVKFQYINTEDNVGMAIEYDIRSLPTMLIIQKEKVVWKNIGKVSDEALITVLNYFSN